jgi:hypothetical protein
MIGGAALASPSKPFPSFRHIEDQRKAARREAFRRQDGSARSGSGSKFGSGGYTGREG